MASPLAGLAAAVLAADAPPARGTPLSDLVPASIVAVIVLAAIAALAIAHRRRGVRALDRLSAVAEKATGLPGWASLPIGVASASLIVAVFGFYWDVSWHIDRGRDPGPFANPAHYFIIVGLAGIALAGLLSLIVGAHDDMPTAIELRPGWRAPVGGVLLTVCGVIALAGFPLDDIWHRLFGQDVTLWGPTHIQMVGGASLATLAMWVLIEEGRRYAGDVPPGRMRWMATSEIPVGGAFLIALSTLQGEFDFGVPQFRQLYQPVLIMLAASIGLVAVRVRAGRGSALLSTVFFLAVRGGLAVLIGPVLGRTTLHFPLYLVEALIVEAVALVVSSDRQVTLGVVSGLGIGTVGLAAEWAWSHAWMPLPWHRSLLPEAAIFAPLAALAGGILGALIGRALLPPDAARQPVPARLGAVAGVAALVCVAWPLPMRAPADLTADVSLTTVSNGATQTVRPTVRLNHPGAADHADWFDVTTWQGRRQGDGGLIIAPLHRVGPDTFTTDQDIPVYGTWKALIRFHKGRQLGVLPVFLPADPAIPAPAFQPQQHYRGTFVADKKLLQREAVGGSVNLQRVAYATLALLGMVWIGSLAWGLRRVDSPLGSGSRSRPASLRHVTA